MLRRSCAVSLTRPPVVHYKGFIGKSQAQRGVGKQVADAAFTVTMNRRVSRPSGSSAHKTVPFLKVENSALSMRGHARERSFASAV
jgi:hypothetical protein